MFRSLSQKLPLWLTRLPRPVRSTLLALLPGDSRAWGPPRRSATTEEVAHLAGGKWHEIFPAAASEPYPCIIDPMDEGVFRPFIRPARRSAGVGVIPGGRVLSRHGFAVGPSDTLLLDAAFSSGAPASETWRLRRVTKSRALMGTVLNLGSTWAPYNFAHQMLDVWPRWSLVARAGWRWNDFSAILAPAASFAAVRALRDRLGVPVERLVEVQRDEMIVCETLVQPTHPSGLTATHYPPWVASFFADLRWPVVPQSPRRLYISRGSGRRSLANERELVEQLAVEGFTSVDASALGVHAPAWFAGAEEIVGVHGAALAHLGFAPAGARLLELFTPDHVVPYYASLAHSRGVRYGALLGSPLRGRPPNTEFSIDTAKVMRVLRRLRAAP